MNADNRIDENHNAITQTVPSLVVSKSTMGKYSYPDECRLSPLCLFLRRDSCSSSHDVAHNWVRCDGHFGSDIRHAQGDDAHRGECALTAVFGASGAIKKQHDAEQSIPAQPVQEALLEHPARQQAEQRLSARLSTIRAHFCRAQMDQ